MARATSVVPGPDRWPEAGGLPDFTGSDFLPAVLARGSVLQADLEAGRYPAIGGFARVCPRQKNARL